MKMIFKKTTYFYINLLLVITLFFLVLIGSKNDSETIRKFQTLDGASHFYLYKNDQNVDNYVEWWYANFYNESNNINGFISFGAIGNIEANLNYSNAYVMFAIYQNNSLYLIREFYPLEFYNSSNQITDIKIGMNQFKMVDDKIYNIFYVSKDEMVNLNLTYLRLNKGYTTIYPDFSWSVSAQLALVKGDIVFNGSIYKIMGDGYIDHNWGLGFYQLDWIWGQFGITSKNITIIFGNRDINYQYGKNDYPIYVTLIDENEYNVIKGSKLSMVIENFTYFIFTIPKEMIVNAECEKYKVELNVYLKYQENFNRYIPIIASCNGKVVSNGEILQVNNIPCFVEYKLGT